jgi:4'-phosphopantetheinyl transferase
MQQRPVQFSGRPWELPPDDLALRGEQVHVWRVLLDSRAPDAPRLEQFLSEHERRRAARYRVLRDRQHFTVARAALRAILGAYLHLDPWQVQFGEGVHGKPALAGKHDASQIRFNMSHSGGVALCAIAYGRAVGIDVERIRLDLDVEQIAEEFFSLQEVAALRRVPSEHRIRAFFTCWVRKEAYIKAKGEGLSLPLDSFTVSLSPREEAALLHVAGNPAESSAWSFRDLDADPLCAAALVVEAGQCLLRQWEFAFPA